MTDVPYEVALGLDLERKVDWVGGVMTHVLHAGLLAGCRKNCRSRLAALMAELLPCGVASTGVGDALALAPQDASGAAVGPDVVRCAALLPGVDCDHVFFGPTHGARRRNGQPGHST